MELSEILDRAKTRLKAQSERELGRMLGINVAALPSYRAGTYLPTDETMLRICLAAGMEPERGLLLLNMWRSRGTVRTAYRRIAKMWEEASPSKQTIQNIG